jgi:hypothetical protein
LPPWHLWVVSAKWQKKLLNLGMKCRRLKSNNSSCIGGTSENICSSSGGDHEKWNTGWNSVSHQNCRKLGGKSSLGPNYFQLQIFYSQSCIWSPIMLQLAVIALNRLTLWITLLLLLSGCGKAKTGWGYI